MFEEQQVEGVGMRPEERKEPETVLRIQSWILGATGVLDAE